MNPETQKKGPAERGSFGDDVRGLRTGIGKAPIVVVCLAIAVGFYYQQSHREATPEPSPFQLKEEETAPKPPPELPQGAAALVWNCVHSVDTKLSKSLWADVYYGMEASFDGKLVVAKVTEKWTGLSDDKRQTVVKLIADTWIENAKTLKILTSGDEVQEVVIKQLPSDESVASWKPATGVKLTRKSSEFGV